MSFWSRRYLQGEHKTWANSVTFADMSVLRAWLLHRILHGC